MIHTQILQTLIQHALNVLLSGDPCLDLILCTGKKLGGDYHIFAFCEVLQSPSEILLACAALVGNGGVEEIDPQFQSAADYLPGVFLINCPGVLPLRGIAESHAAHADTGYGQIRISQFCILHNISPLSF